VFEDHEVIDEEDRLALEQFPDGFQSFPLVLGQRRPRHAVGTGRARHELRPVNVLQGARQTKYTRHM